MSTLKKLRTVVVLLGAAWSASGCVMAAPTAFQIATTALDGASYAATGKSVTDHLVSEVTAKDCAMMRALDGENICKERPEGPYARMEDGTLAPSAIDAAFNVKTADEDQHFQTFAATMAAGEHDEADVIDETAPTRDVHWGNPNAAFAQTDF